LGEEAMVVGPVTDRKYERSKIRKLKLTGAKVASTCAAFLLLFVFAGNSTVQNVSAKYDQEELKDISTQAADKVADRIAAIKKQLNDLAQDQAVVKLFTEADIDALESEGEQKKTAFESALKLRLLLPGKYKTDREAVPPLSFASIDLLKRAEASVSNVAAEVHSFGNDGAHVALVSRVTDTDKKLLGLLHLSMPLSVIESVTSTFNFAETYLEIRQKAIALSKSGDAKFRQGMSVSVGVKGTKWNAASWNESSATATVTEVNGSAEEGSSMGLIILILLVLAAAAGGFMFYRGKLPDLKFPAMLSKKSGGGPKEEVVYKGAVKAIMDGEHAGFENLVPDLPQSDRPDAQDSEPGTISQGLQGDDITSIARPADMPQETVVADSASEETPPEANPAQEASLELSPVPTPAESAAPEDVEISPEIFRTYDIRGVVSKNFSAAVVREIGRAIGSEANERGQQSIVVARDGRTSSPELGDALIAGLRASGRDVIDIGMVPTPLLYFATHHLQTNSGVMLTGSHNGPEYNGLKIILDGETLSGDAIGTIRDRITNKELTEGQGCLEAADVSADYLRKITDDIPVALGGAFKIIVDCGNGVAGQLAPQLYRAMGHDVVELYCDVDGTFPNHQPDPSQPENLQSLIAIVKEEHADLGFAFDGDGDRLGVVDGEGNIIWPDRQMMLFARDVLARNQGATIIFDVKCSRHLKTVIEESGGKPLMWKTGHSLIKSKMKEIDAPLAGEFSGHIFFKERWFGFDDALYAGARALEILTNSKGTPGETFAALPDWISTPELRIPLPEKHHEKAMQIMKNKMAFEGAEITDIDGLRVDFPDGWGLVRPSNTSPFLVARFEAENKEALERIQAGFRDLLQSVSKDLKLPF
jgi:phosphomannomutase/phosphoglucomutase